MSKTGHQPTALLDLWQPPSGAGEPIGVIATTFAFEAEFFEHNCLARFLAVSTVSEGGGSITDLIGEIELYQALQAAKVIVLADRSQPADRSTLQWDALHCVVPTGLLHSKISILLWENATRVLVGSANLTKAGYRSNIEMVLSADLGPECLLPQQVLTVIADEVESYLNLVPGLTGASRPRRDAAELLTLFRQRIDHSSVGSQHLRVAAAPTNPTRGPLDNPLAVWGGTAKKPLCAAHLSPFWDDKKPLVLRRTRELLTGSPASEREHVVVSPINAHGEVYFSKELFGEGLVTGVFELPDVDKPGRPLHAKCLQLTSRDYIAVLTGSSNHTEAGLGLGTRRHREMNIWIGAPLSSPEGKALSALLDRGGALSMEALNTVLDDEDEVEDATPLPAFFGLCEALNRDGAWSFRLGFDRSAKEPPGWRVSATDGREFISSTHWAKLGQLAHTTHTLSEDELVMQVSVQWDGGRATWPVVVDDPAALPLPPALQSLHAHQLLDALARGQRIADVVREIREAEAAANDTSLIVDPHKKHDSDQFLLRRGRALGRSLSRMEEILGRPAATPDLLRARLAAPLGPRFIAERIVADYSTDQLPARAAEAAFIIAELGLSIGRVDWHAATAPFADQVTNPLDPIADALDRLSSFADDLPEQTTMHGYFYRALKEARRCLPD